jgi:glycosyltransferase involved in cell wall biosynthesis
MTIVPGLVSVIIPVHNRPRLVADAVRSVLGQTYPLVEIIVVDDGSTDDTPQVCLQLQSAHPGKITVITQENGGPGAAREAGRQRAQGEYLQYLDSDDILMPGKLEAQVMGLKAHPECGVSYGKTRHYRLGGPPKDDSWKRTGERTDTMFPAFLKSRWWGTSTPLYHRQVTDRAGAWTTLWNEEDWEYDCRIASQGIGLHYCNEFVSDQRWHKGERLSRHGSADPGKLKDRARAHLLIYRHAVAAGIARATPEMRHFARELFLLSRQCGAAGLAQESSSLFNLARQASEKQLAGKMDFRLYATLASVLGWVNTARLACALDRVRRHSGSKPSSA